MTKLKLNSFQIKLMLMFLMVLDHVATYFDNMPWWFHLLGRLVAPVFFYFVVEGFYHTRDRKKYALRLFCWALVMFAGNYILFLVLKAKVPLLNNIFLSLAWSVVLMTVIEQVKASKNYVLGLPIIVFVIMISMISEATIFGPVLTLVFYLFRKDKVKMSIAYVIASLAITFWIYAGMGEGISLIGFFKESSMQWAMIFATPIFFMYSGERGPNNKFIKNMLYGFYPAHLWIIYTISTLINK